MRMRPAVLSSVVPLLVLSGAAVAAPPEKPSAGAAVSYADAQHDAYRPPPVNGSEVPGGLPNPLLSNPALDVLQVDWAPVASSGKHGPGGYSASMTVAGVASAGGSYVSYGSFTSGDDDCQLYHFLTPGITAFAHAFCGTLEDGDRRFVGRVRGSQVVATATGSGGTLLTASFENARLPQPLQDAGSTLTRLSAFTCMQGEEGLGCRPNEVQDAATSALSYRLG